MRGTKPSREHVALDADGEGDLGAAAYWDFDVATKAEFDVPAMINAIQLKRLEEGQDCLKVHIFDSANTSLLTASFFPETAKEQIAQIVVQNPCLVPNQEKYIQKIRPFYRRL